MPQKPEHLYRTKIRRKLGAAIDVWSVHDSYTAGVPDHWYSGWVADLWAEYKYFPKHPKKNIDLTSGKNPKLTRLQQHWLNRKLAQGRAVWVVVGFPDGGVILKDGAWMHPFDHRELLVTNDELASQILSHCGVEDGLMLSGSDVQKTSDTKRLR